MIGLIKQQLIRIVDDIDAGNTNISEDDAISVARALNEFARENGISKYQAYTYLNMSRAKFDNLVAEGKLPKGKKVAGFKELRWYKQDLDKYIKLNKDEN